MTPSIEGPFLLGQAPSNIMVCQRSTKKGCHLDPSFPAGGLLHMKQPRNYPGFSNP